MSDRIQFFDRYEALGIPYPDPKTMCRGQCEGTGVVPVKGDDMQEPWRALWLKAEAESPADDGWHFVKCPDCCGTGRLKLPAQQPTSSPVAAENGDKGEKGSL